MNLDNLKTLMEYLPIIQGSATDLYTLLLILIRAVNIIKFCFGLLALITVYYSIRQFYRIITDTNCIYWDANNSYADPNALGFASGIASIVALVFGTVISLVNLIDIQMYIAIYDPRAALLLSLVKKFAPGII